MSGERCHHLQSSSRECVVWASSRTKETADSATLHPWNSDTYMYQESDIQIQSPVFITTFVHTLYMYTCTLVHTCTYMLMRDAEGRKKQARLYKQHKAKQFNTTHPILIKAVIFVKKMPRVGHMYTQLNQLRW